jgi:hypothetical protein
LTPYDRTIADCRKDPGRDKYNLFEDGLDAVESFFEALYGIDIVGPKTKDWRFLLRLSHICGSVSLFYLTIQLVSSPLAQSNSQTASTTPRL